MRLVRRRGRLRLHLEPPEVQLLAALFDELDTLLDAPDDPDDPVLQRLRPAAYPDDPAAEAEYRELTEAGLRSERTDRVAACRAQLTEGTEVDLTDPDAARRWLQTLNDVRLALGTRLGVTEEVVEDGGRDLDPSGPEVQPWLVYDWLTALQDGVVHALMR